MGDYDDMIHLPHHVSQKHPPMSAIDRAAQFSPFSALTGYEAVIQETGRLTDSQVELEEYSRDILDKKQRLLMEATEEHPEITVTYFVPDDRKSGGSYEKHTGKLKKIDIYRRVMAMMDGHEIPLERIADMEGYFIITDSAL